MPRLDRNICLVQVLNDMRLREVWTAHLTACDFRRGGGNCNPSCVMSVSSEWLIITAKFLAGWYPRSLPQLLKKYEDSLSNFDPSTKKAKKMEVCAVTNVSFSHYSLKVSHCGSSFCFKKPSRRYVTSFDVKNKFGMDKLSLLSKLLFELLSGVFLLKQIESLSFSIDSIQQTESTVCAY